MRITLFDNHDSFSWNLVHDLERLGTDVTVVRDGDWKPEHWDTADALVLSPGPGLPQEHPQLMEVVAEAVRREVPILGVCLGMQALVQHFGGRLRNLDAPLHGRTTEVYWNHDVPLLGAYEGMWAHLPSPMQVGHYHSWVVDDATLPEGIHVNARNDQELPMAFGHAFLPVAGVQFHPESVLTPDGRKLLQGWVDAAQRCLAISASNVSLNFS
jgi:anthranilate synthase component II